MKTCPNCGSTLADNEPYCENCGFDPDFDMGSWNYGQRKSTRKPYVHGENIKNPEPYVLGKEADSIIFIVVFGVLLFVIFIPFYNNDNSIIIISLIISLLVIIGLCGVFGDSSENNSKKK